MDEYWELFRATGAPLFYLLYKLGGTERAAWGDAATAAEV